MHMYVCQQADAWKRRLFPSVSFIFAIVPIRAWPSVGVQLLAALRPIFTKNRTEITSEQVVQELLADPNSPWHEYRGRGPITKNQVAALLRDYDIRSVVVHPTKRAISRGTVTGQRNSRTRSRASCPTSRTSEHSSVVAAKRRESVRMFG